MRPRPAALLLAAAAAALLPACAAVEPAARPAAPAPTASAPTASASTAAASAAPAAPAAPAADARQVVREVADAYVRERVQRSPEVGETVGVAVALDRWTDNSPAALAAWRAREDAWLARLDAVDAGGLLGTPEWLVHGMLREALASERAQRVCRGELWGGVDQIFGWHLGLATAAARQPVGSEEARAHALKRWAALPALVDVEVAHARAGLAAGYTVPRPSAQRVLEQVEGMLAAPSRGGDLWSPAERDGTPAFQQAWAATLEGRVRPALARYRDFLKSEYVPRARTTQGLSALPDGAACYQAIVRGYTSLDVSPAQLRDRAREVRAGMEAELAPLVRTLTGLSDPREARRVLNTDRRFAFPSREAKLAQMRGELERVRGLLPRAFSRTPETPVVVQAAPDYREKSSPPAWYEAPPLEGERPGTFFINLHDAEKTPRMGLAPSVTHEGWPGHHLQAAWLRERSVAHPALRLLSTSAFIEGWGMYAERLAFETGMFEEPLLNAGLVGHLVDALVGLELDPEVHVFGVTREQAVERMMSLSGRPRAEAERYADRHASTPGQLATYMSGYLELVRLREEARAALGERFTLAAFHDVVLSDGPVAFPMLRQKVERWVASGGGGVARSSSGGRAAGVLP